MAKNSEHYDIVLNNGRVMDPETNFDGIRNIGIKDGKIVCITEKPINGKETIVKFEEGKSVARSMRQNARQKRAPNYQSSPEDSTVAGCDELTPSPLLKVRETEQQGTDRQAPESPRVVRGGRQYDAPEDSLFGNGCA